MRYVYPKGHNGWGCRQFGHTWPRGGRIPWWRRLLNRPQTCHRCGMQRWPR